MTATDSSPTAPVGSAAESLPAPVEAGTGEYRRISWALFAAGVATFSLLYATQAVLPQITGEFGVTASAASLSVSVATGALALAVLPMATLSEAVGRRTTMVASLAVATGLGVLIPLSPNLAVLLVLRGLQGIALAGLPATAMAYLGEEMSGRALAGAMGLYVAGNSIGGMTGRLVAGLVADVAGLRAGMWADAALALACTALIVGLLPRSRRFVAQPLALRPLGAGVLAALRDPALRSLYAVAALLMGCFVGVYNFLGFRLLDDPFTVVARCRGAAVHGLRGGVGHLPAGRPAGGALRQAAGAARCRRADRGRGAGDDEWSPVADPAGPGGAHGELLRRARDGERMGGRAGERPGQGAGVRVVPARLLRRVEHRRLGSGAGVRGRRLAGGEHADAAAARAGRARCVPRRPPHPHTRLTRLRASRTSHAFCGSAGPPVTHRMRSAVPRAHQSHIACVLRFRGPTSHTSHAFCGWGYAGPPPGRAHSHACCPTSSDLLACPVCGRDLDLLDPEPDEPRGGRSLVCERGHSFDVARQGYVNLAGPSAAGGDTAEMVAARAAFLDAGHYAPFLDAVAGHAERAAERAGHGVVVDVGAGTGHYLAAALRRASALDPDVRGIAVDTSKPALRRAASAHPRAGAVLADTWAGLPLRAGAATLAMTVFAPRGPEHLHRVLDPAGQLVVLTPTPRHLHELVSALDLLRVDDRKPQRLAATLGAHFVRGRHSVVEFTMALDHPAVTALVGMGPSAWHSGSERARRIAALPEPCVVTAAAQVSVYRPVPAASSPGPSSPGPSRTVR